MLLADLLIPWNHREVLAWLLGPLALLLLGYLSPASRTQPWQSLRTLLRVAGTVLLSCAIGHLALARSATAAGEFAVTFQPIWHWSTVIVIAILLFAFVAITYPPRVAHLPSRSRAVLLLLRYLATFILVLLMLRPGLQRKREDKTSAVYYVVGDVSQSMGTKDASGGLSRFQLQQKLWDGATATFDQLSKQGTVEFLEFGDKLEPVVNRSSTPSAKQTGLGYALEELGKRAQGKKVAGVLLFSDGAERSLPPLSRDPRRIARLLGEQQIPVNTVTLGASRIEGTSLDLALENLQTSPTVFVKNQAILKGNVRAFGASGKPVTIRLLVQPVSPDASSPAPKTNAEFIPTGEPQQWQPKSPEEVHPVEFSFTPQIPGEYKVGLEVVPAEGELLLTNNRQFTFLTVLKGGVNVAYFDSVQTFEQNFIRRIDESPDIQIELKPIRIGKTANEVRIEPEWFRPGQYDVYIIGNVPAEVFRSTTSGGNLLRSLAQLVENGSGLLMLGARHNLSAGGYGRSALADVLPLELGTARGANPEISEEIQMLPTPLGIQHFIMRLENLDQNQKQWERLPKLSGGVRLGPLKKLGQVLAKSSTGEPLLVVQDFDRGRVAVFGGDTTFRWYTSGFEQEHQKFWRQLILWLAHKETQGDDTVWLKLDERRLRTGQPLTFTCGARDAKGNAILDAQFVAEVTTPNQQAATVTVAREQRDYGGKFTETRVAGDYVLKVQRVINGQRQGSGVQARFLVYEEDLELTNPVADPALMDDIAQASGGESIRPEQVSDYLKRLVQRGLTPRVQQYAEISLWDNVLVVLLFLVTLCGGWVYRKMVGLV